jgi:peptidyl-dipeptidase Dcp
VRRREFSRLLSSLPFALAFPAAAQQSEQERREAAEPAAPSAAAAGANAFFEPWERPFGLPPFDRISVSDYAPAFERAMVEQNAEIAAIAADTRPPDFDNAIAAQQRAGQAISRVGGVFWNLIGTESTPELQAVERDLASKVAKHFSAIDLDEPLFRRVEAVWKQRESLGLTGEQRRMLDLTYEGFVRSGALLSPEQKKHYAENDARLAILGTEFAQNVLADESSWLLLLEKADLEGLPKWWLDAAARLASDRGHSGKWAVTLTRSSVEPFLTYSSRRDLREKAFTAWISRGERSGPTDNRAIIVETIRLRDESARLLGYKTYAHLKLSNQMAKTPERVRSLIDIVWGPAKAAAAKERHVLQRIANTEGADFAIAAHDWRYYSNKARTSLYKFNEDEIRSHLPLDTVIGAAFEIAARLFGVTFSERKDLMLYNPDARAFEVRDENGDHVALFIGDYFARPTKRGGAWSSSFRAQSNMDGSNIRPIVVNVTNFVKGAEGQPTLLGLDDARTLFHEFGHGLHDMLSQVTYPALTGTRSPRDFVEFPSQLYEHWLLAPKELANYPRNAKTGARVPDDLVQRVRAAEKFNLGTTTIEFCSSALVDLDLHLLNPGPDLDVTAFERESLQRMGMPKEIVMRHRTPHFTHIFSSSSYAAGYYAYLWSAVLADDAFEAFEDAKDVFDHRTARLLKDYIFSAGGRESPQQAYRHFRGRAPDLDALLRARGFKLRIE